MKISENEADENFNLQTWNDCDNHLHAVDICAAVLHAHSRESGTTISEHQFVIHGSLICV